MRKRKYYLHLTNAEHRLILQCLLEYRNKLISHGKYTDGVDELIIKYTKQKCVLWFMNIKNNTIEQIKT